MSMVRGELRELVTQGPSLVPYKPDALPFSPPVIITFLRASTRWKYQSPAPSLSVPQRVCGGALRPTALAHGPSSREVWELGSLEQWGLRTCLAGRQQTGGVGKVCRVLGAMRLAHSQVSAVSEFIDCCSGLEAWLSERKAPREPLSAGLACPRLPASHTS